MSLAKKSFMQKAAMAAPFVLAFGMAATSAQADVAYGCRAPDKVAALTKQVVEQEGMQPVARRHTELNNEYVPSTIMINPTTKAGLLWQKAADGTVCIYTKYEQAEIFDHATFDQRAFVNIGTQDPRSIPINLRIAGVSVEDKQNPMFRAIATSPTLAAYKDPVKYPTRYVEYMTGNSVTQKGFVFAASLDGKVLSDFTKDIPAKQEPRIQFGAAFTPFGERIIKERVASATAPGQTFALVKN